MEKVCKIRETISLLFTSSVASIFRWPVPYTLNSLPLSFSLLFTSNKAGIYRLYSPPRFPHNVISWLRFFSNEIPIHQAPRKSSISFSIPFYDRVPSYRNFCSTPGIYNIAKPFPLKSMRPPTWPTGGVPSLLGLSDFASLLAFLSTNSALTGQELMPWQGSFDGALELFAVWSRLHLLINGTSAERTALAADQFATNLRRNHGRSVG